MSAKIFIVDSGDTRSVDPEKLPLKIGSESGADIRIAGAVSDAAIALIDIIDGRAFLQPVGKSDSNRPAVNVNGESVERTRWLETGDVIEVQGSSVDCNFDDGNFSFSVVYDTAEYETLPPVIAAQPEAGAETITPVRRRTGVPESPQVSKRRHRIWLAGYGTLALLLIFALYLFTAKAVLIDVDPEDAQVSVSGGILKLRFGGRYLLRPGGYRVEISAEGYQSVREDIEVGDAASQEFVWVMEKLPGRLAITTVPEVPARVWVEGVDMGSLPGAEISLPAGPHALRIATERYLEFEASIEIEGLDRRQTLEVPLTPGWADVSIVTMPAGATVYADEEELATTPATVELMAGTRDVMIQMEGFKTWRRPVTVVADDPQSLPEIQLQEADSLLTVISAPGAAAVSIDGRYRGTTPVDAELSPGKTYQVIISKPGFATVTRRVAVESRQGKTLRIDLEPRVGVVTFVSDPADAELYIDGHPRGKAGQTLSLPAKAHKVEIRSAGFAPFITEITPKPGLPETLDVKLLTPEEAVLASTPQIITTGQGMEMRLIGPGQFVMGAPRREQGRRANEAQHSVKLTRPFYIATREVTNSQFREFKPKHTSGAEKYRELASGDHPAVMLSWEEAAGYCNWLSYRDSLPFAYVVEDGEIRLASPPTTGYRLPTEAEWAWSARFNGGGGPQKYPWGDRMPPAVKSGNYADLSARSILANVLSDYNDGFPITSPVGRFPSSPIGLFDLGGNVAEWVHDIYGVYSNSTGIDLDPVGPTEGQYHVIRGSGWRHASISELRYAYRDFGNRGRLDVGFRIARYADDPK
jgi:formylglycine-generating enzyme required for sulfatase activity